MNPLLTTVNASIVFANPRSGFADGLEGGQGLGLGLGFRV